MYFITILKYICRTIITEHCTVMIIDWFFFKKNISIVLRVGEIFLFKIRKSKHKGNTAL